jgi:hypothetical protein
MGDVETFDRQHNPRLARLIGLASGPELPQNLSTGSCTMQFGVNLKNRGGFV